MSTAKENVFRFVTTRPAKRDNSQKPTRRALLRSKTEFFKSVEKARSEGSDKEKVDSIALGFQNSLTYVKDIRSLAFDIRPFANWVEANLKSQMSGDEIKDALKKLYQVQNLSDMVASQDFQQSFSALSDTILCDSIRRKRPTRGNDMVVGAFRLMSLLSELSDGTPELSGQLGVAIRDYRLVLPEFAKPPEAPSQTEAVSQEDKDQSKPEGNEDVVKDQRALLKKLKAAHREFSRIARDDSYQVQASAHESECDSRITALEQTVQELAIACREVVQESGTDTAKTKQGVMAHQLPRATAEVMESVSYLSQKAIAGLKQDSKDVLEYLGVDSQKISPKRVLSLIENEVAYIDSQLPSRSPHRKKIAFHGVTLDEQIFRASFSGGTAYEELHPGDIGYDELRPQVPVPQRSRCQFQAGVADLLVVKQKLKAYELADFAHVENVLAGELRDRQHRRLNVREEYVEAETEEEIEKERDLQSTERNEMQVEAEKTVRSQFELDAGMQVSGQYGSMISFSTSLDIGFSRSTEESQRLARSYSREVTQRTSERVMERVREEQRRRVLEEVEETNKHAINNTTGKHVRGIYRWLNKIYEAQILNYGQRMMFEFVIPEPAAYFLYAMIENPPQDFVIDEPLPPTFEDEDGVRRPLRPSDVERDCGELISQYNVAGAPVAPPKSFTVSYFDSYDGDASGSYARAGKIEIPEGYEGDRARVHLDYVSDPENPYSPKVRVYMGGQKFELLPVWRNLEWEDLDDCYYGDVSFTSVCGNVTGFALGIDLRCKLTEVAFKEWQQKMYDTVINAYTRQKIEYEEKMAAMALNKGVPILGRNPLENRKIERDELKKLVAMMLMQSPRIVIDAFYRPLPNEEPLIDMEKACKEGATVRFFENAFEWNNMLYVFYPYFWGRRPRWITALHLTDPDPDFAAFLKAGAARVQVPVRPGFERAIAHYCQFGEIWEGNDIPLLDDDLYVPIVNEITENMGKLDDGVPYPEDAEPWEVTVPTSLVVVQDLDEIPKIQDVLTNKPIDILGND